MVKGAVGYNFKVQQLNSYQATSTSTSYASDADLIVSDELVLKTSEGTTRLFKNGQQVALVSTRPGKSFGDHPAFKTGIEITEMEGEADAHAALTIYTALRNARVNLKTAVIAQNNSISQEVAELIGLTHIPPFDVLGARLDTTLMSLARRFEEHLPIDSMFYIREVADTVRQHVQTAFQRGFFAEVGRKNVSKEQYIYVMSQQHYYVKYTTRLLGFSVAYSDSSSMRKHFIKHLSEEVNHEKIIEADLAHLNADVDYLVNDLEPNIATQHFIFGEMAMINHFHDPILLTAAPIAAEGLTAHLDRKFVTDLNTLIGSWGVKNPERASRFLSSHIDFDGGDDGHFEGSMRLLAKHLTTERSLRRFVAALHAQMASFLRIYELGMEESALWALSPN